MASRRDRAAADAEHIKELETACEHFTEACRVASEIIGELIPKVSPVEQTVIHARLGVVEDILDGAVTRYTE